MHYCSIELFKYKRFSLNGINRFKATFTQRLQLILGSNGSGKTSLLRELTALPASQVDYYKDGYKKISIISNEQQFDLMSDFGKTKPHSFKINGEEKNDGGTAAIQKELVWQYFKITSEIHELLLGSVKFHSMGPAERGKWFSKISKTDYQYAIGVYQKLKEKHRDVIGGVKLTSSRIVQENKSLLTAEKEEIIKQEIIELKSHIDSLLQLKSPLAYEVPKHKEAIGLIDEKLKQDTAFLYESIRKLRIYMPFTSYKQIEEAIIHSRATAQALSKTIQTLSEEIESEQHLLSLLTKTNLTSISELEQQKKKLSDCIFLAEKKRKYDFKFNNCETAFQAFEAVNESLITIFTTLPQNTDRRYCRKKYEEEQANLQKLQLQKELLYKTHLELLHQKAMLDDDFKNHPISCPKCKHQWHKAYTPLRYSNIVENIKHHSEMSENIEDQIKETIQCIEENRQYSTTYKTWIEIKQNWVILKPLWDSIDETGLLLQNPKALIQYLLDVEIDFEILIEIHHLTTQYQELIQLFNKLKKDEETSINQLTEKFLKDQEKLHTLTCELNITNKKTDVYEIDKKQWIVIENLTSNLENLLKERHGLTEKIKLALNKQAVNEMLQFAYIALSKREQQLSEIIVQQGIIIDLKKQLETYEKKQIIYFDLLSELSPTDGLIARGLLGFINHVIDQMNELIKKVWFYPLTIMHCKYNEIDGIDLDYKFPVCVNDGSITPDINKTSSAMREIIDLAFKVVCMNYLNISNTPLYLDEFAAMMDDAHRTSAFKMIGELAASSEFSQIFVVSHYQHLYGSLANAQITVLCDANIQLQDTAVFNKHVEID
jgi:hypothetical protein